jgi:peptidoglycan/LPS O-acetylase OafA/YrhL
VAGVPQSYLYFAFDTRVDFLAFGGLLAAAWRAPFATDVGQAPRRSWLPLVTAVAIAVVTCLIEPRLGYAASYPMRALLIAVLVAQLLRLRGRGIWRVLDHRAVRQVGALSYSLYLYHMLIWPLVASTVHDDSVGVVVWGSAALLLASLSYYLVERPVLAWRDRRYPREGARVESHLVLGAGRTFSPVGHLPA